MRLFFAIRLPDEAREKLRAVAAAMGCAKIEQLHFTLAFLGETPRADDACAAAGEVRGAPFDVGIAGAGAFPSPARPRVLWLGVGDGAQPMVAVADALCAALRARGFPLEERPFHPHLTVTRVKPGGDRSAQRLLTRVPAGELARFRVAEFCLMQSVLGAGGAKHSLVRAFPLC
ncbi:MAG TPA: RNA 2',3'-cyclic phosphodiesterase [Myxococcales bacterium]|nr:RNA 2',3'-cyclic phosphodiesterase [Myxococcales bacterium]